MGPEYFFENKDPKLESGFSGFFLFLDFDGTLVPIQNDPTKCMLSWDMKGKLEAIALSGKACIALLSGRTLADIKKRVRIQGIYYGGSHGLEITGPNLRYVHPDALMGKQAIVTICRKIEKGISNIEGAMIEKKKFGCTLHYRMANKEGRELIQRAFHGVIAEGGYGQSVTVIQGKKILEAAPNTSWDKGGAALFILQELKTDYLPIYVGDDLTDETAFNALKEKGITIRVGRSKKTAAKYYLKGQWEVSRLLKHLHNLIQ